MSSVKRMGGSAQPSISLTSSSRWKSQGRPMSDDQRSEIHDAFNLFDKKELGVLGYPELKFAIRALGFDLSKQEVLKMLRECDRAEGRSMDRQTFEKIMAEYIANRDPKEELERAFSLFDQNNTGRISVVNLRNVAKEIGETVTDEELLAMIEEFDMEGKGAVNFVEFMNLMENSEDY